MHERKRKCTLCLRCRREGELAISRMKMMAWVGLGRIALASMAASITADGESSTTIFEGARHRQYYLSSNRCGINWFWPRTSGKHDKQVNANSLSLHVALSCEEGDGRPSEICQ